MKHYDIYRQTDEVEILNLIKSTSMSLLLTQTECDLQTGAFNPVHKEGLFYLHLNRSDEQFLALNKRPKARLVFFDFLCNIPSYWVDKDYGGAATSYYRFAEFDCDARVFVEFNAVATMCQLFLDHYQPEGRYAPLMVNIDIYKESFQTLGIVELKPTRTIAKWKLGQNRSIEQRRQIMTNLKDRNRGDDLRAVQEMEKWIQTHS